MKSAQSDQRSSIGLPINYSILAGNMQPFSRHFAKIFLGAKKTSACAAIRKSVNPLLAGGGRRAGFRLSVFKYRPCLSRFDHSSRRYFVDYVFPESRTPQVSLSIIAGCEQNSNDSRQIFLGKFSPRPMPSCGRGTMLRESGLHENRCAGRPPLWELTGRSTLL